MGQLAGGAAWPALGAGLYRVVRTLGTRTGEIRLRSRSARPTLPQSSILIWIGGAGASPATSGGVLGEDQEYNSIITGGSHMKKGIRKLRLCMEALRDSEAAKVVAGDEPVIPKPLDPPTLH
jgi:hypothetical protein